MNIRMHVSFLISVFGYIPSRGIPVSYGSSILYFLKNIHTLFHSSCTNLHCHQYCTRVPFYLCPIHHFLLLVLFIITILIGVRWYLIVVWICISLTIIGVRHFLCACWCIWKNAHSDHLLIFNRFCCCWLVWVICILWILTHCLYVWFANISSHSVGYLFVLVKF